MGDCQFGVVNCVHGLKPSGRVCAPFAALFPIAGGSGRIM